ncbi:unnamed protein product [marine sediment metagenome]|uniref:Uncharacterized protein n=3 Tax=marine sediment metagenome TaxID=412755 RepID=X1CI67_9ZZZZ
MKTKHLLLGFGFFLYAGLLTLAIVFNGTLIEAVKDVSIVTLGTIVGYIISIKGSNSKQER